MDAARAFEVGAGHILHFCSEDLLAKLLEQLETQLDLGSPGTRKKGPMTQRSRVAPLAVVALPASLVHGVESCLTPRTLKTPRSTMRSWG